MSWKRFGLQVFGRRSINSWVFCSATIRFRLMYTQYLHYLRPAFTRRRAQVFKPIASVAAVTVRPQSDVIWPKMSYNRHKQSWCWGDRRGNSRRVTTLFMLAGEAAILRRAWRFRGNYLRCLRLFAADRRKWLLKKTPVLLPLEFPSLFYFIFILFYF